MDRPHLWYKAETIPCVVRFYHTVWFFFFYGCGKLDTNKWQLSNYSKVAGFCLRLTGTAVCVKCVDTCWRCRGVLYWASGMPPKWSSWVKPAWVLACPEEDIIALRLLIHTENISVNICLFVFLLKFLWNCTVSFLLNVCIQYDTLIFSL